MVKEGNKRERERGGGGVEKRAADSVNYIYGCVCVYARAFSAGLAQRT